MFTQLSKDIAENSFDTNANEDLDIIYNTILNLQLLDSAMESLQQASSLSETLEQLQVLSDVVSKFGMSRELLAFVDHDKTLSSAIPQIPSLESFLLDANIDTTVANEAIIEKIKEITGKFYEAFKSHIVKYREWYSGVARFISGVSGFLLGGSIGLSIVGVALGASPFPIIKSILTSKILVVAVGSSVLHAAILRAKSIPAAVDRALSLELPTTTVEKANYISEVHNIFKTAAGIDINDLTEAMLTTGEGGKPLNSLGYTLENIEKVVNDIKVTTAELKKGESVADKLEALAKSPQAQTPDGRSALIFITGIVTRVMKLSVSNVAAAVHQLKTIDNKVKEELNKKKTSTT